MSDVPPARALPRLLTGVRRRLLATLVLVGAAQAGAAGATVLLLTRGLEARATETRVVAVLLLALVALAIGWLRSRERWLAERLGQDYVHEIRLRLVSRVLDGSSPRSLGATLTRASNDLTAVRNWVALGIAPAAVGVPDAGGVRRRAGDHPSRTGDRHAGPPARAGGAPAGGQSNRL